MKVLFAGITLLSIFIIDTAKADINGLEKLFGEFIFQAPPFSERIRTVNPETYATRTKVDAQGFAELAEKERKDILQECVLDETEGEASVSLAAALGWKIWSNGGYNNTFAKNALLGIIKPEFKSKVADELPTYGSYYHMRVKYEESEPYGWDLFVIADDLLSMDKGRVIVLKVYYSYY